MESTVAGEAFTHAVPARQPCELLTCTPSSCTTLAGEGGRRGGAHHREKSGAITAHNPFVLLHVICLLSK